MEIKNVLSNGAFWQVNKHLAKLVGIESAILLTELIDKCTYYQDRGTLVEIGGEMYFYTTGIELENATTLSWKTQNKCIAKLKEVGFIKTVLKGVPATLHFTICERAIWAFLQNEYFPKEETAGLLMVNSVAKDKPKKENLLFVFPSHFSEKCKALFMDFVAMRTEIKKPIKTQKAINMLIEELNWCSTDSVRIETLQASIKNEWLGLFPNKFETIEVNGRMQSLEEASQKAFEKNLEKLKTMGIA